MLAVFKREFKSYFQSVVGWLFVAAFLAMFGLYFYAYNLMQGYPYIYYTLSAVTVVFLIAVPVLTMRSFAEERKSKTDQLLLTSPVSPGKLVLGKYLAMEAVFTVDIAIFCIAPLILRAFGTVPLGESYIAILAFWLYGSACIAIGMFISSLTESQVIAAVLTFAVLFASYMMKMITGVISSEGNILTKVLDCLDIYAPFEKFAGGCLDFTAILYYLTVIVLMNFLTVQSIQKRRFSVSRKKFSTAVFSTSFIAVGIALAVVVNLTANALPTDKTSIDCSYSKLYSITDDTKEALKKLKEDVTIYALVAENNKDSKIDTVLKRYEDLSKHITVEYVNPSKKPYFYQSYTDEAPAKNSLIVVSGKRSRVIDYYEIYHYEVSSYSYDSELTGFDAEGQLTSAISYVTLSDDQLPVVYEITGHGENTLGSEFQNVIEKANMTLSELDLLNEESVPKDAAAIMINAPQQDFNEADAKKVIDYLQKGGKAVVMGSYTEKSLPNFDSILKAYNVSFTKGMVAENDEHHYYKMGGPFYLLPETAGSTFTGSIAGNYVFVPATLGITYPAETDTEDSEDGITYTSLMDTTDQAVSKNDPDKMKDYTYEEGDDKGPFSLGLAVEKAVDEDSTTQLLVFGSPYLFSDEASQMTANNAVLFSDVISTLVPATESAGIVIPMKEFTLGNLTVNALWSILLGLLFAIFVPVILLAAGIVIFVVRRKK